jgi:hypothetical protein
MKPIPRWSAFLFAFFLALFLGTQCFVSDVQAADEAITIKAADYAYTNATNFVPSFGGTGIAPSGKALNLHKPDAPNEGYLIVYEVSVEQAGVWQMEICASPHSTGWVSPYEYKINDGDFIFVNSFNVSTAEVYNGSFTSYTMPVELKAGINRITFRIANKRSMDSYYTFYLDTIKLRPSIHIKAADYAYTNATNFVPSFGGAGIAPSGRALNLHKQEAPAEGYLLEYSVNVDRAGAWLMEICASPHSTGWVSPYEYKINNGEYSLINSSNASVVEVHNGSYTRYAISVELDAGVNSITLRVANRRSMDNYYTFYLDTIDIYASAPNVAPVTYTVEYNATFNGGTSLTTHLPAAAGTSVDLTPEADKENDWKFVGWNTDRTATRGLISYPAGNITLYAVYEKRLEAYFQDYSGIPMKQESEPMYNRETTAKLYLPDQPAWVETLSDGGSRTWEAGGWTRSKLRDPVDATPITSNYVMIDENMPPQPYYGLYQLTVVVSFNTKGGTFIPAETVTHYVNSFKISDPLWNKVYQPVPPVKPGYDLKYWQSSNIPFNTFAPNPDAYWQTGKDVTFTARWEWDAEAHNYDAMKQYVSIQAGEVSAGSSPLNQAEYVSNRANDILTALNYTPNPANKRQLTLSYIMNFLDGKNTESLKTSLHNILQVSEETNLPVIIHLDGVNWWNSRSDLWNWWNWDMPGYNEDNIDNVERFDWGEDKTTAVTAGWRNWGSWVCVAPAPNLASEKLRTEQANVLNELIPIIVDWYNALPADRKYLLGGVVFGWELSTYTNANYFNGDNEYDYYYWKNVAYTTPPNWNGGSSTMALGYAAAQNLGLQPEGGLITKATLDDVCKNYLRFLAGHAISLGLEPGRIITHSVVSTSTMNYGGGHSGMASLLNDDPIFEDVIPGWSCYNSPTDAAPVMLNENDGHPWAAIEVGLFKNGVVNTAQFYQNMFDYKRNCYVNLYDGGWTGISSYNTVGHKNYDPVKYGTIINVLKEILQNK